ncbi:MAG: hypothetical protein ACXWP4_17445 [Polyangiales bacterium]
MHRTPDSLETAWYASPGVDIGIATGRSAKTSVVLGGELSFVRFPIGERTWIGGYVDGLRDFGKDRTRFSLGPEIGWGVLGLDGGVRTSIGDGTRVGWTIRPMLSFVRVHLYTRLSHDGEGTGTEVGLLFKFPQSL